jgi:hypothetical protein
MASLKVISDRCTDNALTVTVRIPARRDGDANIACLTRVVSDLHKINPDAYDADPAPLSAPEIAQNDGHTADGGGVVPELIAMARLRDLPPDEDEVTFPRACPAGGCGED